MQTLIYPWADTVPDTGKTIAITPFLRWVRMPLPFALDHINLWLVQDGENSEGAWSIIDTGISHETTQNAWQAIFRDELSNSPLKRLFVTHMHPDHVGLAAWLCEQYHLPLWMSMTDYLLAKWLISTEGSQQGSVAGGGGAAEHFQRHGLAEPDDLVKIRQRANYYQNMVPRMPLRYTRLMHDDQVQIGNHRWRVIAGYGHAPEHLSFYCEAQGILISGDMVLPRISTNVSVFDSEPDANPLKLYLDSLSRYADLPADTLVLPSHGKPFRGLHLRVEQLRQHHEARLEETLTACGQAPQSARDLVPVLFKRALDLHQLTFAMGEAIAHLNYLWHAGSLSRELCADGILRFSKG